MRCRWGLAVAVTVAVGAPAAGAFAGVVPQTQLAFRTADLPDARGSTEPSLVIDARGRVYASAIFGIGSGGTPVWRSTDSGRSFTKHSTANVGPADAYLGGGDSALVLDKRDYLYATDLWLGSDSIAVSTDQGESWLGGPVSHRMVGDRNWLAYSPKNDAIYQVWNGVDGLYVARADLDGPLGEKAALSFANTYRLAGELVGVPGSYVRAQSLWPGGIAVDQKTGAVYTTWSDQEGLAFAVSQDKGATWKMSHIPGTKVTGDAFDTAWNYAPLAVDARGNVFVTWSQIRAGTPERPQGISVKIAVAPPGGASWRTMTVPTQKTAVFTQLALRGPDRVALAWVDSSDEGNPNDSANFGQSEWRLQHAEVAGLAGGRPRVVQTRTVEKNVHERTLFVGTQGGDRGMGDFISMAVAPKGDVVIAYSRGQQGSSQPRIATLEAG